MWQESAPSSNISFDTTALEYVAPTASGTCTSDVFRMIKQGAAKIDSEKVTERSLMIVAGSTAVYQVGKRKFARITVS